MKGSLWTQPALPRDASQVDLPLGVVNMHWSGVVNKTDSCCFIILQQGKLFTSTFCTILHVR